MKHDILQLLVPFRPLFSREASFTWFIVIIFGFLLRFDHYGVSSFVRWLHLPASSYPLLIHFFNESPWSLSEVMITWIRLCQEKFPLVSLNGRLLAVGVSKFPKKASANLGLNFYTAPRKINRNLNGLTDIILAALLLLLKNLVNTELFYKRHKSMKGLIMCVSQQLIKPKCQSVNRWFLA